MNVPARTPAQMPAQMPAMTPAETALGARLPNRRMEAWRWTDLSRLIDKAYPPHQGVAVEAADVHRLMASSPFAQLGFARVVFVNGAFDAARSTLPNGARVTSKNADAESADAIATLAARFAEDGLHLELEGEQDRPLECLYITTAGAPRLVATTSTLTLKPGARAMILETHVGEGDYLNTNSLYIEVQAGATLERLKVQLESPDATHLAALHVRLGAEAVFRDVTISLGAKLARQNGLCVFAGEGANAHIGGAYLLAGHQHVDTTLVVDHAVPHCTSRELFKCVMADHARGIFQGKVRVARHAQKTDGKQSSHALLLSETAIFDAKPELEIFADDVVCGHGATAGEINMDHLFYLMARGIPEPAARALLVSAFVAEALDAIAHEGARDAVSALIEQRMEGLSLGT